MGIRDWFKRKVEIRYVPSQPAYQALGYMEGNIYFVSSYSGKVYRISRDRLGEHDTVSQVFTIMDN
jgi:hypothetical protein